ncbi:ATP-binding protein [Cellulomonas triticagri]|uniref:ATP-binding protein n=1 Tax=Cellulomonas triticagri TaxID=2483352 RepID=A0A3M2J5P4_9CELL|nr:ATP-binding protein [Cellulomonas triticagri]RMI09427.1 ATP-binding protein [Cellulomonas triticagri]
MTAPARALLGRAAELDRVAGVVLGARNGQSGALVVRGEPGIGKTSLLRRSEVLPTLSARAPAAPRGRTRRSTRAGCAPRCAGTRA